jgi:hypothetical protein
VFIEKGRTCLRCKEAPATQVHHTSYDLPTMRGEHIRNLVPICSDCHTAEHSGFKKLRAAAPKTRKKPSKGQRKKAKRERKKLAFIGRVKALHHKGGEWSAKAVKKESDAVASKMLSDKVLAEAVRGLFGGTPKPVLPKNQKHRPMCKGCGNTLSNKAIAAGDATCPKCLTAGPVKVDEARRVALRGRARRRMVRQQLAELTALRAKNGPLTIKDFVESRERLGL